MEEINLLLGLLGFSYLVDKLVTKPQEANLGQVLKVNNLMLYKK